MRTMVVETSTEALKVQADYGRLKNKATGVDSGELRLQTQFIF